MSSLLHTLVLKHAENGAIALVDKKRQLTYEALAVEVERTARGFAATGLPPRGRVAVYLPKRLETVIAIFAATCAGGAMVPVNPVLKAPQVRHILEDAGARILVTSADRYAGLSDALAGLDALTTIVLVGGVPEAAKQDPRVLGWDDLDRDAAIRHTSIDADIAALLYTSGSTGRPKGVVLSHRNLVAGAESVATYLENSADDRILAVLPLSFDAGFSQLTTAFHVGATAVLHDYFLPKDLLRLAERERITGITAVPPLWSQLADLDWPRACRKSLRYLANTGGKMPKALLARLRELFPDASPYLMYGLTEAFRSTYLPPAEVDRRPDSIGKAIPNAEILVVRPDGTECDAGEPGELVHRGALVSLGYWGDAERTAERFKPAPGQPDGVPLPEIAVWSGDTVRRDEDGYLYFIGRKDDMIKTSGYRVSPTDIEETAFASGLVTEAAAIGVEDTRLGQRVVLVAAPAGDDEAPTEPLLQYFRAELPNFMVPAAVHWQSKLPRNPNGKIDRGAVRSGLADLERDST
ncbi:MAG: acyl-CoA ligase (AMP-forming), exosortase A system-associated [Pseudomonadota bacterium]